MASTEAKSTDISGRMSTTIQALLPVAAATSQNHSLSDPNVIDVSQADNALLHPELLGLCKDAISQKLSEETFKYPTGFGGEPELLQALSGFFNNYFRPVVPVTPEHVAVGAAYVSQGIQSSSPALVGVCPSQVMNSSTRLLTGTDAFGAYFYINAGVQLIPANPAPFTNALTSEVLLPAIKNAYNSSPDPKRVKGLLICNPHNPFGQSYSSEVIQDLLAWCAKKDIHYISDEVYAGMEYGTEAGHNEFVSVLALPLKDSSGTATQNEDPDTPGDRKLLQRSRVHVLWSASKLFGLPGVRLSWPADKIKGCLITQSNPMLRVGISLATYNQVSSLSSLFMTYLLNSPELSKLLKTNTSRIAKHYSLLSSTLRDLGVEFLPANSGFFVFARLATGNDSWESEENIVKRLREYGVLVSAGREFGGSESEKGWVRITLAVPPEKFEESVKRIKRCLMEGSQGSSS
ncbi:1-aminocyclopropane-1-carboxylate synthase 1 protein [Rutstroemia sp. NJR-2017a WRK4]|nr:1-aminocyclopropane-1-carboxylate synthase 1 protein [Rutstroemia sp. NJR-2017a WRK4]